MKFQFFKKINLKALSLSFLSICLVFFGAAFVSNLTAPLVYGAGTAGAWNLIRDGSNNLNFQWSTGPNSALSLSSHSILKFAPATSVPTWDTSTYFWTLGGVGARYDAFSHEFDVGSARTLGLFISSNGNIGAGTGSPGAKMDIAGVLKLSPASAPNWDTGSYIWGQPGVGTRYDGYQHQFDIGSGRKTGMMINAYGTVQINNNFNVGSEHWGAEGMNYNAITTYGGTAVLGHSYNVGSFTIGEWAVHSGTALWVNGAASRADNLSTWTVASDARLKKNVQTLDHSLDKLLQLRGVSFDWKDPSRSKTQPGTQMGLIAQEVEKVFPQWVGTDGEGFKSLSISGFEGLSIEALRELKNENDQLKKQLEEEKKRNDTQNDEISKIKKELEVLREK